MNEYVAYVITAEQDGDIFFIEEFDNWWMTRNPAMAKMVGTEDIAKTLVREAHMEQVEFDELSGFIIGYAEVKITVSEVKGCSDE